MPSIKEKLKKSKYLNGFLLFGGIALILGLFVAFGAIKLAKLIDNRDSVSVAEASFNANSSGKEGGFVASKTGSSYYFPWCGIAGRIKEENKVWFSSRVDAEKAGYKPASNCHGLK